jgi:small subunit ribosomal protein S4
MSDYKRQLLEKQRMRAQYNIQERQMRNYVKKAVHKKGNSTDNLIQLLETRLDSIVFRAGLAHSIYAARQYVSHRHILLNGKWVNIPSQQVKVNEVVSVKKESRNLACFIAAQEEMVNPPPPYMQRDKKNMSVKLLYQPKREEVMVGCEMPLVIEYYSR